MGRKSKYRPELKDDIHTIVLTLMREGASKEEICAALRVTDKTLMLWTKQFPEFEEVMADGLLLSKAWWLKAGRKNLYNKDFNSTLWYMNMKNRHQWSDKVESTNKHYVCQEDALKELE